MVNILILPLTNCWYNKYIIILLQKFDYKVPLEGRARDNTDSGGFASTGAFAPASDSLD